MSLSLGPQVSLSFVRSLSPPPLASSPTRRSSDLFTWSLFRQKVDCSSSLFVAFCRNTPKSRGRKGVIITRVWRSEEHTSELQSRGHLVCRLVLEKKNRCARARAPDDGQRARSQRT